VQLVPPEMLNPRGRLPSLKSKPPYQLNIVPSSFRFTGK
jgi:hypothetical protein